jgi:hypothetical protein
MSWHDNCINKCQDVRSAGEVNSIIDAQAVVDVRNGDIKYMNEVNLLWH